MFDIDPRRRAIIGPLLTALCLLLAELFQHGLQVSQLGATFLLLALAPIAYSGLRTGFANAFISVAAMALYTLHYTAPHAEIGQFDAAGAMSFGLVLVLGIGMAWPMDRVRRREARLNAQLEARAKDLEARNKELTNANASLEAFGYVVSHDLKEPVRALENYLDAARQEWPKEDSKLYIDEAYEANRRLTRLLEGLLSYSRTSSLPASAESVALADLIRSEECSAQYVGKLREQGARIEVDADLPVVMGDRVIVAQLFGNLILNAVRHHPEKGGIVRVRGLGTDGGRAHVAVEDNGRGFPPDVLARFGKLQSGRPATIKTGFGLAIAHRAAQRLGGHLWLANRPEGGAIAHVELPLAPSGPSRG